MLGRACRRIENPLLQPRQSDLSNSSNLSETFDNISEQFPKKYLTNRLNPDILNLTDAVLNWPRKLCDIRTELNEWEE